MQCETCNALLGEYKQLVKVFTSEVMKTRGAFGPDSRLAARELDLLRLKCQDAREAVVTHWRQDHDDFGPAIVTNGSKSLG